MRRWLTSNTFRKVALPLIFYTCVAFLITWPLVTQLSTHVVGFDNPDSFEYTRLGWWGKYALQHGLNPFYQSLLGYPEGFSSPVQLAQPLIYWPISFFGLFTDPVAAFNLWILLEVILSGLTAYWLCLTILDRFDSYDWPATLAAMVGGLVFMAFPTVQTHLMGGQVNPLANYALPLLLIAVYRIIEGRGGLRIAILGAVSLLVLLLGNFTAPVFAILPIVLFGGLYLLLRRPRSALNRLAIRDLAIVFIGGTLLALPFYIPVIAEALAPQPPSYLQEGGVVYFSSDVLNFTAISPFTPWTAKLAPSFSYLILNENLFEGTAYLGLVAVVLAIVALIRNRRKAALWLVIALGCMLFSLGPELKFNGQPVVYTVDGSTSNIVLPWALFQNLPLVRVTRTPGRFNFTTGLALGVLAALGLDPLLRQIKRPAMQTALAAALAAFTLAEYQVWFPFPTTSAVPPAYFTELAARSDVRAVFDVPWNDAAAQRGALFEQVLHHKPMIAGYVSRGTSVDPAKLTVLSDILLGKAWNIFASTTSDPASALTSDQVRTILADNGIDVVVYHWGNVNKESALDWAKQAFGLPAYQDTKIAVFEVSKPSQKPAILAAAISASGWWRRSSYWMTGTSSLYLYIPSLTDTRLTVNLLPVLQTRRVDLRIDGQYFRSWTLDNPQSRLDFYMRLSPGFHDLRFNFPEGCAPLPIAPACLVDPSVAGKNLTFADPACDLGDQSDPLNRVCVAAGLGGLESHDPGPMAYHEHAVQLANGLRMRGYRLPAQAQPGSSLLVETDWRATQKLPGDYHFFIHVYDQQNKLAAQYDNIPNGGKFSTTQWSVPQDWTESDTLALPADLPPGTYRVFAGWYRFPDLQRLTVDGDSPGAGDGLVYLGQLQITSP